jgi:hypothetical protein
MKHYYSNKLKAGFIALFILAAACISAQTTSWKGITSITWSTASNWTNGVPTATLDAILGDANFTGAYQPKISGTAKCKNLTIGGTVATTLTLSKGLTASGNITISSNGSISQGGINISLTGNWTNNGSYTATASGSKVTFAGTSQTIGGSATTSFRKLTVNASSTVTLLANISVTGSSSKLVISGVFYPNESSTYTVSGTGAFQVTSTGTLKVMASTFAGNYSLSGTATISAGSTIDYAATTVNQTVSSTYTYSTLKISGSGTKSLAANLPNLTSSTGNGNIYVNAGTFDISSYNANRGTSAVSGTFSVANGATLKIGGTNSFPTNYASVNLSLSSTVEYGGTAQTVSNQLYGNLTLSSSSSSATKTMPGTAMTVAGNMTSTLGSGTAVLYTAGANLTVSGTMTIGTSCTFSGSSYSHTLAGNLVNNGTLTGNTSSITLSGAGTSISGSGTNGFNNLTIAASAVTCSSSAVSATGNFATSGPGAFTHSSGTFTMSGTSKTISGTGITFNNLTVSGSITTASSLTVTGSLSVSNSLTASAGVLYLSGTSQTVGGGGTISLYALSVSGTISCSNSFSIGSSMDVSNSFTASAGAATFTGTSTFNGTVNLFNVILNGTSLQLSTNAMFGIAGNLTITSGTLNVTSTMPNTVIFNGSGAQTINGIAYNNLTLSNGNTKRAGAGFTVNADFTISSGTTFAASTYTHSILGNWINNATFSSDTSIIQFTGAANASISGNNTFKALTINKTNASNTVTLSNNVSVPTLNMTNGIINTGSNYLTITSSRSGNGFIYGNITRTHSFTTGTAYEFEGPNNTITFSSVSSVSTINMNVALGSISDFPFGAAVNRTYTVTISGTYTATLRLHYEDAELNGSTESSIELWKFGGSWSQSGKTGNSTSSNYVEQSSLTSLANRWTISDVASVVKWTGGISTNWGTAGNWSIVQGSASTPPASTDIVQLGAASATYQPTITTSVTVKSISFQSTQAATLTLGSGGSLTTNGNINGTWGANAAHTIDVGARTLTVNGDLELSDASSNHTISLALGTGTATVLGNVTESGGANITFSGAGTMNIGGNYTYTSGTFTPSSGTVVYNGTGSQVVGGGITYNDVTINKASGIAAINTAITTNGNLLVSSGELDINAASTIAGNATISSGATMNGDGITTNVGGNWINSGTFISASGTINFNGTGAQSIASTTFNSLSINKSSGTATLSGNSNINGNLTVAAGTLDLASNTVNRSSLGGVCTLSNGATLSLAGSANFPANFNTYALGSSSTVLYNGSGTQTISGGLSYGNLTLSNGASNAKTLGASLSVNGDISINSGATLAASSYTLTLGGNWTNNGTFTPSTSTVVLIGATKTIAGNTTFNRVTVYGSYTVNNYDITLNGYMNITSSGSYAAGSGTHILYGDLTNSGSLSSTGTTTFMGTAVQTIRFINAISSVSTGIINFNGTVSPVLNSNSSPTYANLNINNTGGITASVDWIVFSTCSIASGATFNGGSLTHRFYGSLMNSGTISSAGTLNFTPVSSVTLALGSSAFSSSGILIFGGSGAMTITGTPSTLTDVIIANSNSAGVSPPSGWTIDGDLNVSDGAKLNAGSYSYTVGGDIILDGILVGGTSSFSMTSATGAVTSNSSATFNNFTVTSTGNIVANNDFQLSGNFTNNGIFDGTIGGLVFTGSTASIIGGSTTPSTIAQITNQKTGTAATTLAVNISTVASLWINTGIFDQSSFSISQDVGGGELDVDSAATMKLGGTNTLPTFTTYVISPYSTIEYNGSAQSIPNTVPFGHFTISSAGTKTAGGALTILGNYTQSAGTFTGGSFTHNIAGNWNMSGGAFTNTGTTINLNGTVSQDVSSTGAFNNLTVNNASGITFSSSNTVNGTLTLTSGKVSISTNDLTIGSSGSISGASSSSYIVTGLGSLTQRVTAGGSNAFPVGNATHYMPASISLTGGSTTDNFSVRTLGEVRDGGSSGNQVAANAVAGTWFISEAVNGGSTATLALTWNAANEMSGFDRSSCRLGHFTAGAWEYGGSNLSATGSNPYTLTRSGITSFSPFGVGGLGSLPVSWLSISAQREKEDHIIRWTTASEKDCEKYIVESSSNGKDFIDIGTVKGSGNSLTIQHYTFKYVNAGNAMLFYRIRQIDYNSNISYSEVVSVKALALAFHEVGIYPNPAVNDASIYLTLSENALLTYTLSDATGRHLAKRFVQATAGAQRLDINMDNLATGMYYILICDDKGTAIRTQFFKQ